MEAERPGPRPGHDMADIIDLMLATGCRIGEILALRWSDLDLDGDKPTLTVAGTIKTERGRGTYRKPRPKSDSSYRTIVLPTFAVEMLVGRHQQAPPNDLDAVFATRNGTWHQVGNVERRWRQIREHSGFHWVTPHTFRKSVATLIADSLDSETAAQQLGHSSSTITKDFYIEKPAVAADVSGLIQSFAGPRGA